MRSGGIGSSGQHVAKTREHLLFCSTHQTCYLLVKFCFFFVSFLQYETPGLLEGVNSSDFFSVVNPKLVIELPPTEHKKEIYLSASVAPRVTSRMSRNAIANDRREEDVVGGRGVV